LIDVVLKTNRETNSVGLLGDEGIEANLISCGKRETSVGFITVNIVGLNTVTTLGNSEGQTLNHNIANNSRADVHIVLAFPPIETVSNNSRGEGTGVWSPVLVLSAEVADNNTTSSVKRRNSRGSVIEEINIVHLHVDGLINGSSKLPLPCGQRRRSPP